MRKGNNWYDIPESQTILFELEDNTKDLKSDAEWEKWLKSGVFSKKNKDFNFSSLKIKTEKGEYKVTCKDSDDDAKISQIRQKSS